MFAFLPIYAVFSSRQLCNVKVIYNLLRCKNGEIKALGY